ncbi:hypothetical protein QAD02_019889 [Eretmocerus hayati]|uniref:Uncharacterized protein n=1 Tax=Eretmocerus hayati TaxID=131215 RepID=A0ACC2PL35_9HYME|nr:hypothetical protein QAD02_019889 [Eretmocerus hayati]
MDQVAEVLDNNKTHFHVESNTQGASKALFTTTLNSRRNGKICPLVIFFDLTHNIMARKYPILTALNWNQYVQCEMVAIGVLAKETRGICRWVFNIITIHIPSLLDDSEYHMGDEDLVNCQVVRKFLDVPMYIWVFHVAKTLRAEIVLPTTLNSFAMTN